MRDWGTWKCSWLRHYATSWKVAGSSPRWGFFFSIYLIHAAALWPWGRLSVQQKWASGIFLGVKSGRRVGQTTLPPSVSQMSENVGASTSRNPTGLHGLYRDNFTFTCVISMNYLRCLLPIGAGIAQSVYRLATGWMTDGEFESRYGQNFLSTSPRPVLGPTHSPSQ
jgi:hypothetical protein